MTIPVATLQAVDRSHEPNAVAWLVRDCLWAMALDLTPPSLPYQPAGVQESTIRNSLLGPSGHPVAKPCPFQVLSGTANRVTFSRTQV